MNEKDTFFGFYSEEQVNYSNRIAFIGGLALGILSTTLAGIILNIAMM